jgi:D-3-phosphoglycerate dehydrogenase
MYSNIIFLFDFDSTFIQVESLDILANISLKEPDRKKKLDKIANLTQKGMNGSISFSDSLKERMHVLSGSKNDIKLLIKELKTKISISIRQQK